MDPLKKQRLQISISALVAVIVALFSYSLLAAKKTVVASVTNDTSSVPPVADITKRTIKYKDGLYTATGSYDSPGGMDQLGVSVTLKNDIVTSVDVTPMAGDRTSARYQERFISGYKSMVVGKNIDSLNLTWVSGSSLTPAGFNDALSKIKAEARA